MLFRALHDRLEFQLKETFFYLSPNTLFGLAKAALSLNYPDPRDRNRKNISATLLTAVLQRATKINQ
jgi:hypothetical protein